MTVPARKIYYLLKGAIGAQYHVDLYGPMGGINGRLPSDRLLVEWHLLEQRFTGTDSVVVAVPALTAGEIAAASEAAMRARVELRNALVPLFAEGWRVTDADRIARTYTLSR